MINIMCSGKTMCFTIKLAVSVLIICIDCFQKISALIRPAADWRQPDDKSVEFQYTDAHNDAKKKNEENTLVSSRV